MNYDAKPTAPGFAPIWIRPKRIRTVVGRGAAQGCALALGLCALMPWHPAPAAQIDVEVRDRDRHPVGDVVVTLSSLAPGVIPAAEHGRKNAVMDQIDRKFVPQVMVISRGTWVEFPNNDAVSHQVYSFSPAKRFQLPLYKGQKQGPILFDKAGLVVLGCNIHDSMVGYIYVTDAVAFGKTNQAGAFASPLPPGKYRLEIWSPRISDNEASLTRELTVDDATHAEFRLNASLRALPEPRPHPPAWDSY